MENYPKGIWRFTTEQCVAWLEAILQHYGSGTTILNKMMASLEALQLEIGSSSNSFLTDYDKRGALATPCWMKAVWERIWLYKIGLRLKYATIPLPRERDCELVELILRHEPSTTNWQALNRCRMSLQVIFLSCITSYSGTHISSASLSPPREGERTSSYRFPKQQPTSDDWAKWRTFWHTVYPSQLQLPIPLGKWKAPTHKIWPWVFDSHRDTLYRQSLHNIELYVRVSYSSTRSGGTFAKVGAAEALPRSCEPVDVQVDNAMSNSGVAIRPGRWVFPRQPATKQGYWEVLRSMADHGCG